MLRRREFIGKGVVAGTALAFGPAFWRRTLDTAAAAVPAASPGPGPYGPLGAPDANGIRLPAGFRSRVIARATQTVPGTDYQWPVFPDGSATFPTDDGGYILVVNSETPPDISGIPRSGSGGASAIRFRADGTIADAYRILGGTNTNCAGGPTPWGTWLSCEEHEQGRVWECDPTGRRSAVARPAMGIFDHEAAAVDDVGRRVYLTEDRADGCFYRFTPTRWPDLSAGVLEAAIVGSDGKVRWGRVEDPSAGSRPTREQVAGATRFRRGEGIWHDSGFVYVATTADQRVWEYNTVFETISVVYDGEKLQGDPLADVDNVTAAPSGDVFVCEDSGDPDPLDICIITPEGEVARFLKVTGPQHTGTGGTISSELTGVTFDPSGRRMYFSSQRGFGAGITFEITGPFRTRPVDRRKPRMEVTTPDEVSLRTLEKRGVPVGVLIDEAARLDVRVIMTRPTPSRARRRRVTVARSVKSIRRGRSSVKPKGGSTARSTMGTRTAARARVEVRATDAAGNTTVVRRRMRVKR